MGEDKRLEKLPEQQYISFDVFDTLIKRSVARPEDIFLLMEEEINRAAPGEAVAFAKKRKEAAQKAAKGQTAPITLEQIYSALAEEFGEKARQWMELAAS